MQSSSGGGEEEYDSRAATDHQISNAFLTNSNSNNNHQSSSSPLLFDPQNNNLSNFFSNNNLDNIPWPKPHSDPIIGPQTQARPNYPPPIQQQTTVSPNDNSSVVVRNPKKRSRASRRAPTTVLTTDTSNFRAMVQEFTGIPAPPFTAASSPFGRTRLDIFGSGSGSTLLQRPFAQYRPLHHAPPQSAFAANSFNSLLQPPPRFPALAGIINAPPFAGSWGGSGNDNVLGSNDSKGSGNDAGVSAVDHEGFLRAINGGDYVGASERVLSMGNGKTTSDFHVTGGATNKVTENGNSNNVVSLARGEGMVESWICSSD